MNRVISKVNTYWLDKGKSYWFCKSDFREGCWHIYAADNKDAWLFNIFDEDEFRIKFEEA